MDGKYDGRLTTYMGPVRYSPLSFLYLVYNSNAQQQVDNSLQRTDLNRQEQVIGKLTYLKQF